MFVGRIRKIQPWMYPRVLLHAHLKQQLSSALSLEGNASAWVAPFRMVANTGALALFLRFKRMWERTVNSPVGDNHYHNYLTTLIL
eukprot:1184600-Prorocentrum_minimum.AAC.4